MFGEKIFDDGSKELDFEEVTHTHSPNRLLMVVVIIKGPCEIVHGSSLFSNKSSQIFMT